MEKRLQAILRLGAEISRLNNLICDEEVLLGAQDFRDWPYNLAHQDEKPTLEETREDIRDATEKVESTIANLAISGDLS